MDGTSPRYNRKIESETFFVFNLLNQGDITMKRIVISLFLLLSMLCALLPMAVSALADEGDGGGLCFKSLLLRQKEWVKSTEKVGAFYPLFLYLSRFLALFI